MTAPRARTRLVAVLAVVVLGLTATACSGGDAPGDPAALDPETATVPSSSPGGVDCGDAAGPCLPRGSASALPWDEETQEAALEVATTAMTLFARRDVAPRRWWADLKPYLSAQAAQDYRYTDPASVPPTQVTGAAQLVDLDSSEHLVTIAHLPTDAGLYALTLSRSPEQPTWAVERITPPETAGD